MEVDVAMIVALEQVFHVFHVLGGDGTSCCLLAPSLYRYIRYTSKLGSLKSLGFFPTKNRYVFLF